MRRAFDDARAANQDKPMPSANRHGTDSHGVHRAIIVRLPGNYSAPAALCVSAAPTKLANSGCGRKGFERNSGWNCTATYQG